MLLTVIVSNLYFMLLSMAAWKDRESEDGPCTRINSLENGSACGVCKLAKCDI